ncbi:DUF2062 domain-containing protein [Inhella sp. 4Y17]|uniref:DUF2062 domain-containing protein n=1 Tax=Inhella gelatinilytica TaxID=2795030 RepID=A0A931IZZ0_9BURK|nr:DUF2062 domain-containing protein [Inhella gelatinilytica]
MGPLLRRPWLWQLTRRRVAAGAGIGVFFGLLIPVLQIAGAATLALVLRANLPVAAFSTLVSNPLTYAPIGFAAYKTGSVMLGEAPTVRAADWGQEEAAESPERDNMSWTERLQAIGKPLFLGLLVFAVVFGSLTWLLVYAGWAAVVRWKWARRHPRSRPQRSSST